MTTLLFGQWCAIAPVFQCRTTAESVMESRYEPECWISTALRFFSRVTWKKSEERERERVKDERDERERVRE